MDEDWEVQIEGDATYYYIVITTIATTIRFGLLVHLV